MSGAYAKVAAHFKKKSFSLELADTFWKMGRGLMGRGSLAVNGGMLFVFAEDGSHGFWMLNMKMSIDIIWLDGNKRIVHIWRNAEPCRSIFSCKAVTPEKRSRYVVELRAGTAKKLGMEIGDRFSFSVPQLGI